MNSLKYKTQGGVEIELLCSALPFSEGLTDLARQLDSKKGALFSSGFDYPGRHSRWEFGFVDPALEFIARNRRVTFKALNEQGQSILPLFFSALKDLPALESCSLEKSELNCELKPFSGFKTEEERTRAPSVFSVLRAMIALLKSPEPLSEHLGFYGAFGYDLVLQFETLELKHQRQPEAVDCHLYFPLDVTIVDRKKETSTRLRYSLSTPSGPSGNFPAGGSEYHPAISTELGEIRCDHQPGEFEQKVRKVLEGTARGDYFEVVLSQSFSTGFKGSASQLFANLCQVNPSPYLFLINLGQEHLVGASPEMYVRISGRRYETCPIAGTISRGQNALEDSLKVRELLNSNKDESELTMCTDVDRNDMARVCEAGSVRLIGRRQLEFYSHLIHTVDHLEGQLREDCDSVDAFQSHMWACTVTGAPKPAALQEIENLEASPRGWYSGAIGFISSNGDINTGITLRTAVLKDGLATVRAGATLLYWSTPELEEQETRTKAAAFLRAVALGAEAKEKTAEKKSPQNKTLLRSAKSRKILLVDYKDSFVHNLASYLRELGHEVITLRHGFLFSRIEEISPDLVLLSPGPASPRDFGVPDFVGELVRHNYPVFGVCLGHQAIGEHFGAELCQLPIPQHGQPSPITHSDSFLFEGLPQGFTAGRYHSLYLRYDSVPECLEISAYTLREQEKIPMAFCHRTLKIASVQFHPESLMTLHNFSGHIILRNAIDKLTA